MKNIKLQILGFLVLVCATQLSAQTNESDTAAKSAIRKLGFLTGAWEGEGWRMGPDGMKHTFQQKEHIQFKLDSTLILIEGMGTANEKVIHNAMAIITRNDTAGNYTFSSYLQNGNKGNFKAELKEEMLYWYPNEHMRFRIWMDPEGKWQEAGEMNRDGSWFQFLEMTLTKVK